MAGFVMGTGAVTPEEMNIMSNRIRHRGSDRVGAHVFPRGHLIQHYLHADVGPSGTEIPVPLAEGPHIVGYDGHMGNWKDLAASLKVTDGALREERLLLALYNTDGVDMLRRLTDAVFAFVIVNKDGFLAARDLLGIKTLFYGYGNDRLYLASELKSIIAVTNDVYEFPPGHFMQADGKLVPFTEYPEIPPAQWETDAQAAVKEIRRLIEESFSHRVDFVFETGSLLSGGIDSSAIAVLAAQAFQQNTGGKKRLKTFAFGVNESQDILNARKVARHIGSDHEELMVDLKQILDVLPEVIYHLESFDPSLVRSAVSNFMISRHARQKGIQVLLSGEGGDEVFCGYAYLKSLPFDELYTNQIACLKFLHNNASLRLDRMNQCNGVRVVTPLISGPLLDYALKLAPELKQKPEVGDRIEKWIFRKAFEADLPDAIVWRLKQEFSQGSGSADVLPRYFEETVPDAEFEKVRSRFPMVRSKEECYYFNIFTSHFGTGNAVKTVGQWVAL
ncbi:MAG: hypothetical protein JRI83_09075 [Deltaproteobacteria bacterium]|nr:hypothetical protein [Deltaproteobacteria bacterium]MBW1955859.1 hypothetical protein [Deltaproteobacteria bacterium]